VSPLLAIASFNDHDHKFFESIALFSKQKVKQIVGLPPHSFLLLESAMSADYQEAPIPRRSLFYSFGLLHVGTATKSVRQYRRQMARFGRASATEPDRALQ
jgi:hypothetical protein